MIVVTGSALLLCQFGSGSSKLSINRSNPVATTRDCVPFVNIHSFGCCSSPQNPSAEPVDADSTVQAPCIPATAGPWSGWEMGVGRPGPAPLTTNATVRCQWGGVISILAVRGGNTHG
jgi:hypothetical protein